MCDHRLCALTMVKNHKRKMVPAVQWVKWIDRVTSRGTYSKQVQVTSLKTHYLSSPVHSTPSQHVDQLDEDMAILMAPLMMPKSNGSVSPILNKTLLSYIIRFQT